MHYNLRYCAIVSQKYYKCILVFSAEKRLSDHFSIYTGRKCEYLSKLFSTIDLYTIPTA
jgi:hypothetical protein